MEHPIILVISTSNMLVINVFIVYLLFLSHTIVKSHKGHFIIVDKYNQIAH
jgi:hypothetical protein